MFDNSKCYVSYSWLFGKSCTGLSCSASSGSNSNNCVDSYTYNTMSNAITGSSTGSATPLCLKISCKNLVETCDATAVTANFYVSTSSVVTTCDASTAPTNGGVGTCTSALASGSTCQPTCNSGYSVSGVSSCSAGTLSAATCVASSTPVCLTSGCSSSASTRFASGPGETMSSSGYTYQCCVSNGKFCLPSASLTDCPMRSCDASTAPTNGGVGTCTSTLASGSTCQPTCNSGYTVSGTSSCNNGILSAATCVSNTCDASTAPTNGGVGTCTSSLAGGSTCQPTCNSGYTVSGVSSCSAATSSSASTLSAATCLATSSGDCKCTCCSGSFCIPSVAGLFSAGSSSACNAAACRTQYSGSCPASGSSGSVSATYTASSAPSTPLVYSETGTLSAQNGVVTEAITGMSCAKYKMTLTSASSTVIVAAYTEANANTIIYKYNSNQYLSMNAAVVDVKARAVATSLCDFADFNDSVCEKVVLLNAATTYRLGALNSGSTAVTGTVEVSTCTSAELAAAQSSGSTVAAAQSSGSTVIDALLPISVGIAGLALAY